MARKARRVLSVASECAPFVKTGGLADVVGALPAALREHKWKTRILIPAYAGVLDAVGPTRRVWKDDDLFGGPARVRYVKHEGLKLMLLDAPHLFDRPGGPYLDDDGREYADNQVRFAALSWVASRIALEGTGDKWRPDIVHAHDWQAGLTASYLKYAGARIPTVQTIHNVAFQGMFGADQLDRLRLPTWDFHPDSLEYHGFGSALKAGLVHAAHVTTVSPTYAEELCRPEFGFGLEGVLRSRRDRGELTGILNGIDVEAWDPANDPNVLAFPPGGVRGAKHANRARLLREFGLEDSDGPLAVVVTRLTHQKGIDLLIEALPGFIEAGGRLALLGSGDYEYERSLVALALRYAGRVGVRIGYDEALSHRMYAGGDTVLVPSRFEPCGLTQMYGLRYGAVPVVASTGGLRDSVVDATPEALADGTATGFTFGDIDAGGLGFALGRSVDLFADTAAWSRLRDQAMRSEVSWDDSAKRYVELFESLLPA